MKKNLTGIAKKLRNNLTEAEKFLWYKLRAKNLKVKFRRQVIIGRYIVDFVCFEKKLVIEVDGGQHCQSQEDIQKDIWLNSQGFKILRFWNNDVLKNRDGVLETIEKQVTFPLLKSSPQGGGKRRGDFLQQIGGGKLKIMFPSLDGKKTQSNVPLP